MDIQDLEARAGEAARLMKAMSNPHRLSILCRLLDGERCVSELEETASLSQSALSQHLAKLRESGLVITRREAQNIYYSLAHDDVRQVLEVLHRIFCDMASEPRREVANAGPALKAQLRRATDPAKSRRGAVSGANRKSNAEFRRKP